MQTSQIFKLPSELNFHKMPKFSNNVKNVVLVELFYYILVKTEKLPKCIALRKTARLGGKKLSIVFRVSGGKLLERGKYWH